MAQVYAAKYLAKAALSAPKDMVKAVVAKYTALHPTVFIFHCTFVCDARCEMCSNWTRGNRKEDMSLEQIERAFSSPLWSQIENASLSGGEPTTRNDMVDICRLMIDKFPKLRKLTINTTGLTPQRGIPMLTKVVEMCHERNVIFSTRVSIDGVGDMHGEVRNVRKAFEKAGKTIAAMQELQRNTASTSASRRRSSRRTSRTPTTSWPGRRKKSSTSSSTWCASPRRCSATRNWKAR
jgi:organic radical activating enzyme